MSNVPPEPLWSHGVLANQTVGVWRHDLPDLALQAERELRELIRQHFQNIQLNDGSSVRLTEDVRSTPIHSWIDYGDITGPDGSFLGRGWQIHIKLDPNAHAQCRAIVEHLPSHRDGFEIHYHENEEINGV
jgi:hypothetical protein